MKSLFLVFALTSAFAGEIIVATVAQVKSHVITTREAQINFILDKLLKYEPYLDNTKDPVEQVIQEWLLYFEASEFYTNPLPMDKASQALASIKGKFADVEGWKKLDVKEAELIQMLKRKMEARRLYNFKKQASMLPVSDAEVEAEYKQNRIRYGTLSLDEVKEKIRQRKINENLNQRMQSWFAVLEKKYRVQRFAKYDDR